MSGRTAAGSPTRVPGGEARAPGVGTVLWSDRRLVAVAKPPGLSLATRPSEPGAAVLRLLESIPEEERALHDLDAGGLLLVHRLDVGTSGVVLLARDEEAHKGLVRAISSKLAHKTYLALVWGRPRPREGRLEWPLGPDKRDRRKMRVDPAGKPAATRYRVLSAPPHAALVQLEPETGRTHQIRVHLAFAGHPVVGDDFYGGPRHRGVRDRRLRALLDPGHSLLHAWHLAVPRTQDLPAMAFEAPLPEDFTRALEALEIEVPAAEGDAPNEGNNSPAAGSKEAWSC